jgi:hypothetical protein
MKNQLLCLATGKSESIATCKEMPYILIIKVDKKIIIGKMGAEKNLKGTSGGSLTRKQALRLHCIGICICKSVLYLPPYIHVNLDRNGG